MKRAWMLIPIAALLAGCHSEPRDLVLFGLRTARANAPALYDAEVASLSDDELDDQLVDMAFAVDVASEVHGGLWDYYMRLVEEKDRRDAAESNEISARMFDFDSPLSLGAGDNIGEGMVAVATWLELKERINGSTN